MNSTLNDFVAAVTKWRIWFLMGNQDIELRYRRSMLGPFWISLAMATLVFGIGLLYSKILNIPFREYLVYFGCGLLAWNLLASSLTEGCQVLMEAEGHIKAIPIPITLFSARMIYRNIIIFAHNLLAILLVIVCFGKLSPVSPLAVIGVLLIALFGYGASLVLAPLSLRFRDIPQLVQNLVQMLFFLTPIFWRGDQLSARHPFVEFNPAHHFIELVRGPLIGVMPSMTSYLFAVGATVVALAAGFVAVHVSRRSIFLWL